MPPAISDDEQSDSGDFGSPPPLAKRSKSASAPVALEDDDDDDDMKDLVKPDVNDIRNGRGDAHGNDKEEDGEDDDEEDEEDDEEDVYIVEKILSHRVDPDQNIRYEVKWEGYEKKSDRTWESSENLKENASEVLDEYLQSVGGEHKILEDARTATKTKKRGRPAANPAAANGAKRKRTDSHPASATPPASKKEKEWKPPVGSWEEDVQSIDACHDETTGKLMVYLTWTNGKKTQHETKVIYQRCPQQMLRFYERNVKIVSSSEMSQADK